LKRKSYGSIPHIPGSRLGVGDKTIVEGQEKIATLLLRDRFDEVIVQEKLDGSCMAVAKIKGEIVALSRAGYLAETSPYLQHQYFSQWVKRNQELFLNLLHEKERIVGEWLSMAHGIRYELDHAPFVVFDIMSEAKRIPYDLFKMRVGCALPTPYLIHRGGPLSIENLKKLIKVSYHGGEFSEGAVYRIQRKGEVDFLTKWVNGKHKCGSYFVDEKSGEAPIWNWLPPQC